MKRHTTSYFTIIQGTNTNGTNAMTAQQKRSALQRMQTAERDLAELRRVRTELAKSGYASASISSGGGSKSYTRADVSKVTDAIRNLVREIAALRSMLTSGSRFRIDSVLHIFS